MRFSSLLNVPRRFVPQKNRGACKRENNPKTTKKPFNNHNKLSEG